MGAFVAKYFSATKNSSDTNDDDDGVVASKMETRPIVNKISKSCMDKNDNYVSSDLNKYVRGSVSVSVQLFPLQAIEDKKQSRKDGQNKRLFLTRRIKRKIGLKKCKFSSCENHVSVPRDVDRKVRVDLKRLKLPPSFYREIISNKSSSSVRLQVNPKTLKERKNNEEFLRQFNEGHLDDMFDFLQIPNHLTQMNLLDTSSSSSSGDEEDSSDDQPGTSIINRLPQFSGWSEQTPDPSQAESEDDENDELKGQLDEYVHRTIADRRKKLKSLTRVHKGIDKLTNSSKDFMHVVDNGECSSPKRRKSLSLNDYLSDLNPALEKLNKSQQDLEVDDDIEIEPYFDEDI